MPERHQRAHEPAGRQAERLADGLADVPPDPRDCGCEVEHRRRDEEPFRDARGKAHDWRRELFVALQKRQNADGSFVNKGDKTYGEADPNLATAFALLSLSYTTKK